MRTHSLALGLGLVLFVSCLVGCPSPPASGTDGEKPAAKVSGTGTVNVQRVLSVLGLAAQVEQVQNQLNQQFNAVVEQKRAEFQKKRKEYPEKLSDDQTRELQKLAAESDQIIQQVRAAAQQRMNDFNTYVVNVLRNKVAGPMETVAKKHQMGVVLVDNNVFYHLPETDITDEVLDVVSKSEGGLTIPALTVPPATAPISTDSSKGTAPAPSGGTPAPPTHTEPAPKTPAPIVPSLPPVGTTTGASK